MATPTTIPGSFTAGNVLTAAQMNDLRGAFRILQVVSTTKTDLFTTTSTSVVSVTGTDATITPSATSSKILIIASGGVSQTGSPARLFIRRNTTEIASSTGATTNQHIGITAETVADTMKPFSATFLDSPNTTSAITYRLGLAIATTGTARMGGNNSTPALGAATTITVMEISA
jgi:hypothetical protein